MVESARRGRFIDHTKGLIAGSFSAKFHANFALPRETITSPFPQGNICKDQYKYTMTRTRSRARVSKAAIFLSLVPCSSGLAISRETIQNDRALSTTQSFSTITTPMHSCRIGDFDNDMVSTLSIEMDFLLASSNEGYADTIEDFVIQHIGEGTFDCSEEGKKSKVNEWTRRARDIGVTYLHVIKVLSGEWLVSNQTESKVTYHCVLSATKNFFSKVIFYRFLSG